VIRRLGVAPHHHCQPTIPGNTTQGDLLNVDRYHNHNPRY
ncbi:hypothetical protein LINPERHAP2_LOCUS15468, partial [Linum perenne]